MAKRRNRRLRKKLRVGEFQELGFEVRARVVASLTEDERSTLLDRFVEECIEPIDLGFGGGLNDDLDGFVVSMKRRASATDEQREKVRAWLSARSELSAIEIGPLTDAWHGVAGAPL